MKIIHERVRQKQNEKRKTKQSKTNEDKKEQGGAQAIVKGWELNDFVVHLSYVFSN